MTFRSGKILLTLILGLLGMANIAGAQQGAVAYRGVSVAPTVQKSPEESSALVVHAAQRGNPHMNLLDGHAVPTNYVSGANSGSAQMTNAKPLALASADFDEDGVPDLVSGYAASGGTGVITVHRGNVDSLWPYGAAIVNGPPPEFLPNAKVFSLPEQPDFVGVGDFNADGHWDIVAARRGSSAMWILLGDRHGNFSAPQRIQLTGGVTALVTGEMNRADGLNDIVVGVNGANGAQVLVYEAPNGAMHADPEIISASAPVTALVLGRIDNGPFFDLAIGAGNQLMMVHGRDRKLTLSSNARGNVGQPNIVTQSLPFSIRALAVGNFSGLANLAALGDDGAVHLLENSHAITNLAQHAGNHPTVAMSARNTSGGRGGFLPSASAPSGGRVTRKQTLMAMASQRATALHSNLASGVGPLEWSVSEDVALPATASSGEIFSSQLIAARVSTSPTQDLLVMDRAASQIHVLSNSAEWDATSRAANATSNSAGAMSHTASFDVEGAPAAVLPMRLNKHPLQSLVVLADGQSVPSVAQTTPLVTLVVTNTQDSVNALGDNPDSLRAWIQFINGAGVSAEIDFNIPLTDPNCNQNTHVCTIFAVSSGAPGSMNDFTIDPLSSLFTIDAYTQPGASPNTLPGGDNAVVLIRLDGTQAKTPGAIGFDLFEIPSTIRGFNIAGFNNPDTTSSPGFEDGAFGIDLFTDGAFVEGNFIGTNASGTASVQATDNNLIGIFDEFGALLGTIGTGNVIGGTAPQARNIISANGTGIHPTFDATLTQIQGNFIGTDVTGTKPLGNFTDGILAPPFSIIGGTQAGAGNVVSTNGTIDVDINAINGFGLGEAALVQGNFIGTEADGATSFGRIGDADVEISVNYQLATIGGTTPAARNILSGANFGIRLADGVFDNLIEGNYIGVDVTGTKAFGNVNSGILSDNFDIDQPFGLGTIQVLGLPSYSNTIGGAVPGAGNVISGNFGAGIEIAGSNPEVTPANLLGDIIQGNLIGTDATGTVAIPNGFNGIWLTTATVDNIGTVNPMNNVIGGTNPGEANVISNNTGHGILINAGANNATVGNTIQNNTGAGVRITAGNGNLISRNSIFGNGALGIDLDAVGPNANSPCQANTNGANMLQNAPVLTAGSGSTFISATATDPNGNTSEFSNTVQSNLSGNILSLLGNFNGLPNTTFTIEFFSSPSADASGFGQGQTYLGSTSVTSNVSCIAPISTPVNLTQADMSVTESFSGSALAIGADLGREVYTSVVTNNGPATAHNVVFTDPLPAALQVSGMYCNLASCQSPITTTLGTCTVSTNTITCNLGTMPTGATATITVPVQALVVGSTTNTVNVAATEADPNPANNSASVTENVLNAFPVVDHLDPAAVVIGGPNLTLDVYGVGFLPTSVIKFNGTTLPFTFFDNQACDGSEVANAIYCADLQIVVPAAMLTTAGDATISVTDGTNSSSMTFTGFIQSACSFNVLQGASSTVSVISSGEIAQFTTQTLANNCPWTASSQVPWITQLDSDLAAGGSRSVSAVASYSVAPNTTGSPRTGTITQAGQVITFNQAAGSTCTFTLTPGSVELASAASSNSITVTASDPVNCLWQPQSFAPWITVAAANTAVTGSGTVNYSVSANTGGPRAGSIVVASVGGGGTVFQIAQDPANNCFFTLSSTAGNFPTSPGTGTFAVTASQPSCAWTANSDSAFAAITSGNSGTGNGTVNFSLAANTNGGRTANITVGNTLGSSANFAATQAGAFTCSFTLTPASVNFPSDGGTGSIGLVGSYSFCIFSSQSNNPDAVQLSNTAGTAFTVAQNTGAARVLTITIGCQTFTINQAGAGAGNPVPTVTTLSPASIAAGGPNFTLTVNGSNFVSGATVLFNGLPRVTTFVNAGQLTAAILASDIPFVGTATVVVTNPVPGGGVSNSVNYSITGTNPVPAITTISPTSASAGNPAFTLTVNGTGFTPTSVVSFGGAAKTTTFISVTQITAAILATDIASGGTPAVIVTNPTPGGGPSNSVAFNVITPVVTITSISPPTVAAGSGALILSVFGTNFLNGATVNFGSIAEPTEFENSGFLIGVVQAADVANPGTPLVTVTNPGGTPSNGITFTITGTGSGNPVPSISSLSPTGLTAGSAAFMLTVNGANFISSSTVNFGGAPKATTFVSATQLMASILAADVATAGTPAVSVTNSTPGGGTSNSIGFNIGAASNPAPTITSLVPNSATAGGASFSLIVNGTNLISSSVVNFNGSPRTTTFVSGGQVTAAITAADIAAAGSASITVANPAPGGGTSSAATLAINNPFPTVSSISPASGLAGGAAFTLTVNGTGFNSGSVVNFNHVARTTSFVNSTQVTAAILASDIAASGAFQINVTNPTPGGGTSTNNVTFQVNNPVPTISSLSPTGIAAGSTAFTLTINGTNFVTGATVSFGGVTRAATVTSSTQLTTQIIPIDVATAGTPAVIVTNPTPGGGASNSVNFNVTNTSNPVPTISALSPNNASAGSAAFTLTVSGTNFVSNSVVDWIGAAQPTTFVNATTLTASISAADIQFFNTTVPVVVVNPAPGGGPSNTFFFNVTTPVATLSTLSPNSAIAGGAAFNLTVNGSNFENNAVVQWNGSNRTTTFVSGTQLTAAITAADIASVGTASVAVFNPLPASGGANGLRTQGAPAGTFSNTLMFTINAANPLPTITSLSPSSASAGSAAFTLTVNGTNYISSSVVQWNGSPRTTIFVSATQLTAAITAADIQTANLDLVSVVNPAPGGGTSNVSQFNVTTPIPVLTSLAPNSATAGGAAFTLTLNGSNFINTSVAQWKGSNRTTTFVSSTQLTASITAADIATAGTASVTVFTPTVIFSGANGIRPQGVPSGITSNALTFTINGDFSVSATTTTQTVPAGSSGTYTIATAPIGGTFPGQITFSASGLPAGASASFSPSSVTAGTSTTMTITTTARGLAKINIPPSNVPPTTPKNPARPMWLFTFAILLTLMTMIASAVKFGKRTSRRLVPIGAFALLLISVGYISGCSGGGFPKVGSGGTPAGTFTVTVTGTSGSDVHSTTVTLTVQ